MIPTMNSKLQHPPPTPCSPAPHPMLPTPRFAHGNRNFGKFGSFKSLYSCSQESKSRSNALPLLSTQMPPLKDKSGLFKLIQSISSCPCFADGDILIINCLKTLLNSFLSEPFIIHSQRRILSRF